MFRKKGTIVPEQTGLILIALLFLLVVMFIIMMATGKGQAILDNFKGIILGAG